MIFVGIARNGFWPRLLAAFAYGLPILLIVAPLASFLAYSFFLMEGGQIVADFNFGNYRRIFTDAIFIPILWRTCLLCLAVAALAILVGFPVAFLLANLKGRRRYLVLLMVLVPLLMSYIIKIYAIRSILGGTGFLNRFLLWIGLVDAPLTLFVFNLNAVLLTLTILLIPFAILPIFLSLERIPRDLIEASSDLGASSLQTFARIILPLSVPGIVTAASFVFVLAIGDFLTPQMVGGQSGFTFGRIVYSQFGTAFNWPFGAALATVLAIVAIAVIAAGSRLESPSKMMRLPGYAIGALWVMTSMVFLLLYSPLVIPIVSSFFVIAHGEVQWHDPSLSSYAALTANAGILEAVGNTLIVGFSASLLSIICGTLLAIHYCGGKSLSREAMQFAIYLPFLMPPIITGLSLLIFFRETGIPRSLMTVIVAHTVFVQALTYRTIVVRLQSIGSEHDRGLRRSWRIRLADLHPYHSAKSRQHADRRRRFELCPVV